MNQEHLRLVNETQGVVVDNYWKSSFPLLGWEFKAPPELQVGYSGDAEKAVDLEQHFLQSSGFGSGAARSSSRSSEPRVVSVESPLGARPLRNEAEEEEHIRRRNGQPGLWLVPKAVVPKGAHLGSGRG